MDKFERQLGDVLRDSGSFDTERGTARREEIGKMYDDKLKTYRYFTWGILAFETVCIVLIVGAFMFTNEIKWLIGLAAVGLAAYQSTILMKLWYWQMDTKLRTIKEVKELQLQIVELSQRLGEEENRAEG